MKNADFKRNRGEDELTYLQGQISECRICRDMFGYEPRPIIQGNRNAKILQISQAPSKNVNETGKPFNDSSGKRLREEWYRISENDFYNPDNFYILAMAHCYPGKIPGGGDRPPPKACLDRWILKEMELVNNEIYILIGGIASSFFFPGKTITSLAFENNQINGKPAYSLPHPSPLNIKWFKDHPQFLEERIFEIQKEVHRVLGLSK